MADEKVTVFCERLPLRDVMRQLSRPFGYTWLRSRQALGVGRQASGEGPPDPNAQRPTPNAGFRYELMPPYGYKNDTASNWQVPYYAYTPADAVGHPHPVLVRVGSGDVYAGSIPIRFDPAVNVVRDGRLGDNLIQTDYKDFAPRLGIAWSPRQNLTVRPGGEGSSSRTGRGACAG